MATVTHYIDGKEVSTAKAKAYALQGYSQKGYGCVETFEETWNARKFSEEARSILEDWANMDYQLEIMVEYED